ncbi:MAG: D-amino acid aminotransferase [Pseudomonadota bacterium]|nr:D-amino acid aminotransferase [Pseudomonadota bacterium]
MIYLNGEFMPLEEARISVLDRGFLFGDGVYEVIPVYSRRPFRLEEHLERLEYSLAGISLVNPFDRGGWRQRIEELIALNPWEDQSVYLQITRGVAKRDHAFPVGVKPTVFMMSSVLSIPGPELVREGANAVTVDDFRWSHCDIKSISLLPNVLLRQLAVEAHANEAILLREGWLTEGAASNIFIVRDGVLCAPPKDHHMLAGITYDVIVELAHANDLPVSIGPVPEEWIHTADEIWQTSSTREVLAITRLNGKPVGSGVPGPMFKRIYSLYQEYKHCVMKGENAVS